MAENAKSIEVAEHATAAAKAKTEEKPNATQKDEEAAKTSEEEVKDEICRDSEYGSKTPPQDDPRMLSSPTVEPPPPVRDRTLGGIDYYLLSYDDPPYEDEHYEFFPG